MKGDLQRRENWGTLAFAFVVWAAHFSGVYAAALVFPTDLTAIRLIAAAVTAAALALLLRHYRGLGPDRSSLALLSLALALMAICYQTLPVVIG